MNFKELQHFCRTHACLLTALGGMSFAGAAALTSAVTKPTEEQVAEGRELFLHEWTLGDPLAGNGDGVGPVFNARSCAECHFLGGTGGAGPNSRNVRTFEVLPRPDDPLMHFGVVHAQSSTSAGKESDEQVAALYPPFDVPQRSGCFTTTVSFNPVRFDTVNTPALFGAGLIDDLSGWAIANRARHRRLQAIGKELSGEFNAGVGGRVRILPDGRVGKFGWKAQFATLEDFVAAACAVELGLANPRHRQMLPGEYREDLSAEWDMTRRQLASLVAYCDSLPHPRQAIPDDPRAALLVAKGEEAFQKTGCADCHVPNLGGIEGVYSDFCLHRIARRNGGAGEYAVPPPIPRPGNIPDADEWKTPPLWGVADTAPYLHDGSATTLEDAILKHEGQAAASTREFRAGRRLDELQAIVAFLKTLRAPQAGGDVELAADQ